MLQLKRLVGLPCQISRRAADLRGFHFGKLLCSKEKFGLCYRGELILHTSSFWRIVKGNRVVVCRDHLWVENKMNPWKVGWDYSKGNLQDDLIKVVFPRYRKIDGSNYANGLIVTRVTLRPNRDMIISLKGGYKIEIFNNGHEETVRLIDIQRDQHYIFGQRGGC